MNDPFDASKYQRSAKTVEAVIAAQKKTRKAKGTSNSKFLKPGFVSIPLKVRGKLKGVRPSTSALHVLCCLLDISFNTLRKGDAVALSNEAAAFWGMTRKQKRRGLDELVKRSIVTFDQCGMESPRVKIRPGLMK